MSEEFGHMERIFKVAKGEMETEDPRMSVYRTLVFNRFYDTIKTSFPAFSETVGDKVLGELVREFIKEKHRSPLLLDVSKEFYDFFRRSSDPVKEEFPFLEELLFLELVKLELFTSPEEPESRSGFSWEGSYTLSPTAKLLKFRFPVHKELSPEEIVRNIGSYHLLLYRDPEEDSVKEVELTDFVYGFLESVLFKGFTPWESLDLKGTGLKREDIAPYLERFMEELLRLGVIRNTSGRSLP